MNDQVHDAPALRQRIEEQTELVGKWEDARRVPDQKRLTWFYPDFGCYVLNYYVTAERFYMFKDRIQKGSMETREEALEMIHLWQSRETHPLLRSQFSIIEGEEEMIPYPSRQQLLRQKRDMER